MPQLTLPDCTEAGPKGLPGSQCVSVTHREHPICADRYPVTIYYCKADVKTGMTVRVSQPPLGRWKCRGVRLENVTGTMLHGNATGPAKASGARCVLVITKGDVWLQDHETIH